MTARIKEEAPGVTSEALAPRIQIHWDPITNDGVISFDTSHYIKAGDAYIGQVGGGMGVSISLEEFLERSYEIEGHTITGHVPFLFAKMLYDELYNESMTEEAPEEEPLEGEEDESA